MASVGSSKRRARSAMDTMMIHDMKNMEFRLNLLLSNLEEHYGDPDFKRSVVAHLNATLEKIESIVDRWAAHQESILIKVSLDLNDLLRQMLATVQRTPLRGGDGGRLRISTSFGEIPRVWGDPYYLEDAFSSLFHNALEAAADSGSLVQLKTFEQQRKGRRSVVVEIADDGPGMPKEFVRERLFRPFQTTKQNGVGLGLYTAKQILLLHRGAIDVTSEPGRGTRVRIMLPAAEGATS